MLYLIDPRGAVWSAEATLGRARARTRVDGRPIDDLPFKRAAMVLELDDYVDLALRHGVAAPRGLLLDDGFVQRALAPSQLKAQQRNQDAIAEQLEPVHRHSEDDSVRVLRREAVHEGASRALATRIKQAEKAAKETLQADPDEELIGHWTRLGGRIPATIEADRTR